MRRETFIIETIDWLNRRVAPEGVTVDVDTPLFECGIVSSLGILRLIAWTEKAIGREIPDREIRMDRFATVRLIAENFVHDFVAERGSALAKRPPCAACGRCSRRAA